jgi:hypothetical protein
MFNWKATTLGVILAIILGILIGTITGTIGSYLGVILAGIVVGYMVNENIQNGAIHGAIIGIIGSIILAILTIIVVLSIGGTIDALIAVGGLNAIIQTIITWGILGTIGGAFGALINKQMNKELPAEKKPSKDSKIEAVPNIKFERENMVKCICQQCPVQKESECAQNKMKMLQISMKGMSPEPSDFPGMYCANGKAICSDLDPDKKCNCINCDVWKEHNLNSRQPGIYFCQNGKAK